MYLCFIIFLTTIKKILALLLHYFAYRRVLALVLWSEYLEEPQENRGTQRTNRGASAWGECKLSSKTIQYCHV
jgi:hypothetical protein